MMSNTLLRNRNFVFLCLAQICGTLGAEFFSVAAIIIIFESSGSILQTSFVMLARMIPSLLLSPLAGAFVDRYTRRKVLLNVNLLRIGMIVLLFWLPDSIAEQNWPGYCVVALLTLADVFYMPAQQAYVPILVAQRDLVRANSVLLSATQLTLGLARGAAPLLLWWGISAANWIALISFAIAAVLMSVCCLSKQNQNVKATTFATTETSAANARPAVRYFSPFRLLLEVRDGWRYLRNNTLANSLVKMEYFEYLPHGIWSAALMLAFTQEALQEDTVAWGYLTSIFFFGQLIGSALALLATPWIERYSGWIIIINAALNSLLTFAFAITGNTPAAILLCFAFGPPSAMRDVAQDALLQANVTSQMLGRVYATRKMMIDGSFLLSALCFGLLADKFSDIRLVYLIGATLYLCTALYALSQRVLRSATMVPQAV